LKRREAILVRRQESTRRLTGSVPAPADSLGEEGFQLSRVAALRVRHHLLAQMQSLEIGS
jgi:hypothetical protein